MNSEVHPAVVALVLFLTAVAIGVWMWGSGAATSIGGPAELRAGPDGHHYVQIQNYLVEHDENGEFVKTHDLESIDVELFLGTYGFFSNGDVLLRRGPDPRSFGDNLRAFARKTNLSSISPETADSGLFRCDLHTQQCERFGNPGVDFKAAHGIFIDRSTDEVYISDTTRHLLRKYSPTGEEVAATGETFKFPNQLVLHEGRLYVADTNHHKIQVVEPGADSYGDIIIGIDVVPTEARLADQRWPSHFVRVGSTWWVNNMKTGMNLGGLYVFNNDWHYVKRIALPEDADPISMIALNDEVWVSDWNNDVVRRFAASGDPLPDLESAGLEEILARSRVERRQYTLYSYGGVALVVFVLLALLVRAYAVSMNTDTSSSGVTEPHNETGVSGDLYLEPDEKALKRMRVATMLVGILLLPLVALLGYVFAAYDDPRLGIPFIIPVVGLFLIYAAILWIVNSNRGTAIRISGDTLTLRDHTGRESSCALRDVRYSVSTVATRDAAVFLGQPPAPVYSREAIANELIPRLASAQQVNPFTMTRILIELQHPQGVVTILALVAAAIIGIAALLEKLV